MAERFAPSLIFGPLALLGADPPPTHIASGDRVSFSLFWQAITTPGTNYALRWRLMSLEGDAVLGTTVPLSPYPTAHWRDRELEQVRYDLTVPPNLPVGDYSLVINVLDANGVPLGGVDHILARIQILTRDQLFSLPQEIAYPLDVRLGEVVHLRGFDFDLSPARPTDQISLTLYWQADGPIDLSYTVFVHLTSPAGKLYGQMDHPPAGGAAPTQSWTSGQVVIDEIALPLSADAPPGAYRISVGLYNPLTGERLPAYDTTGTELPNRQIVLPAEVIVEGLSP
jgi:hypothetical protein